VVGRPLLSARLRRDADREGAVEIVREAGRATRVAHHVSDRLVVDEGGRTAQSQHQIERAATEQATIHRLGDSRCVKRGRVLEHKLVEQRLARVDADVPIRRRDAEVKCKRVPQPMSRTWRGRRPVRLLITAKICSRQWGVAPWYASHPVATASKLSPCPSASLARLHRVLLNLPSTSGRSSAGNSSSRSTIWPTSRRDSKCVRSSMTEGDQFTIQQPHAPRPCNLAQGQNHTPLTLTTVADACTSRAARSLARTPWLT